MIYLLPLIPVIAVCLIVLMGGDIQERPFSDDPRLKK